MSIEQAKQGRQFHQPASAYWIAVPLGNEFYSGGECPRCSRRTSPSRRARFPAYLLDGHMPNVDGFALAEQIQKQSNPMPAVVMMLTSAGHLGDGARCRALGISGYLVKPIRQRELLNAICQVLGAGPQAPNIPLGHAPHSS